MDIKSVILEGVRIRMEPLELSHVDRLAEFAFDEGLWRWTANVVKSKDDLQQYVARALDERDRSVSLPFVTVDLESGDLVGSSRFGNIDKANRKVEIGWTWVAPDRQRTHVNTEAKLLMLTHAFEVWKCIRVELKTDALNAKSRAAIRRIGAVEEGILRNQMIIDSGRFRDTVYFSIIDNEWKSVQQNLTKMLER
ncbi:MAG TPA: GNAT family protein [Pyrinomonadaceae bacterium]|nr:GNAT family protein [Pyrinomonadaceae bacterium]